MIKEKLKSLGIELKTAIAPLANYVPYVKSGNMLYIAGQLPRNADDSITTGRMGEGASIEEGQKAARSAALSILQQINDAGYLEQVVSIVKITGFVNVSPQFYDSQLVMNGASDFFNEVFADKGVHARSSVGVASLPRGALVEIEAIIEIKL